MTLYILQAKPKIDFSKLRKELELGKCRHQILWLVTAKDGVIIISHVLKSCMSYNEDPIVYRIHTTYTAGARRQSE